MFPQLAWSVAGDAAYNGVICIFAESNPHTTPGWIACPRHHRVAQNPRAVIAGHKRPGNDDSPKIIEETRQYIRDFDRVAGTRRPPENSSIRCSEIYPDRINPGRALEFGARSQP